jgi:quinol---cytochrome c reductase iron-sulfur subunit, bacillus type
VADSGNDKQGAPRRLEKPEPPGYFQGESMTRRKAFTVAGGAIGGIAGAAIVLPAIGFAVAPLFEQEDESWQTVGATSDFSPDTYRPVVITAVPGIGETGKTTAYVRRGNPSITANQTKYPPETPNEYIAISTRCAHVGCPVRFVQAGGNFICPCHGGVYGFLGERIGGPPVRPLDRFQTRIVDAKGQVQNGAPQPGDQVQLGPRYSVTNSLEPVRARDPGEFTGGIWDYLYPPRPSVPPPP